MAKVTERRCGGLLHFLKNWVNETKLGQTDISGILFYKIIYVCDQNDQKSKINGHKFPT